MFDVASFIRAGRRMWVLVFPETVTEVSTAGEAGQVPFDVRGATEASVRRWSGVYAGAWAREGTPIIDRALTQAGCLFRPSFPPRHGLNEVLLCACWFDRLRVTDINKQVPTPRSPLLPHVV